VLFWFRSDLRLDDNTALIEAAHAAGEDGVVPVFVWSPEDEGAWPPGAASRVWLHHSLAALGEALGARESRLLLRKGPAQEVLPQLARETNARAVFWNRRHEPAVVARDQRVEVTLREAGAAVETCLDYLLFDPEELGREKGSAFKVFTPFWRACQARPAPARPRRAPRNLAAPETRARGLSLEDLGLLPSLDWAAGIRATWTPGEAGAHARMRVFARGPVTQYGHERDRPDREGVSRFSPHLHFGELSPRHAWHLGANDAGAIAFRRELAWREFAYHLLVHFPRSPERPLDARFEGFPWTQKTEHLRAWTRGHTGYPMVDAGMRQLWTTGWVHNRVRMVVASFLIKHLLIPWQDGARWFWDTLVDADLGNNTLGWQWTAGCGADAAPFFRVFNPVLQGEKFDPDGTYVRRYVPELERVPAAFIHKPWQAPAEVLTAAGVVLGKSYPRPLVDHDVARKRALAAFAEIRAG
jgi:deoxyribodipyrimidine photo-lyase